MALALAAGCDDYLCEPWSPSELFNRGLRSVAAAALQISGTSLICGPRSCPEIGDFTEGQNRTDEG